MDIYLTNSKVWFPWAESHDLLGVNCCQIYDEGFLICFRKPTHGLENPQRIK